MHGAKLLHHPHHPLHRIIGTAHHPRTEKKSLDVVATIKLHGQRNQLRRGEHRPGTVVAAPVDAVGAIVHAVVGEHDLEQRHAAPVLRETVAYAPGPRTPHRPLLPPATHAARRARHIVFRRLGKYLQLIQQIRSHLLRTVSGDLRPAPQRCPKNQNKPIKNTLILLTIIKYELEG